MAAQKEKEVNYIKSVEFLCNYCWKGKTREQIIHEMELVDYGVTSRKCGFTTLSCSKK